MCKGTEGPDLKVGWKVDQLSEFTTLTYLSQDLVGQTQPPEVGPKLDLRLPYDFILPSQAYDYLSYDEPPKNDFQEGIRSVHHQPRSIPVSRPT